MVKRAFRHTGLVATLALLLLPSCKKIEGELEIKVVTGSVKEVGIDFCVIEGEIVDLGGGEVEQYGFCIGESEDPTLTDTHSQLGQRNRTGLFSDTLTGISCNTTYFVRAYATNVKMTSYGQQVSLNTLSCFPVVATAAINNITQTSAQGGGNVTDDGGSEVTAKGSCWSTSPNPTLADDHTTDGSGTGSYTSLMEGLTCGTQYYVRAYATNSSGTGYGEQVDFTTSTCVITAPVVSTSGIQEITDTSAVGGGTVISNGNDPETRRGVCWSTWHTPTIDHDHTDEGTGEGSYTSAISGLEPSTTYYVRAYATNREATSYGGVVEFTTLDEVVTDVNGNIYQVVELGTQTWMAENLRTTKYNDGTPIDYATDNNRHVANYCWYDHDEAANAVTYGALYNAYAVCADNLCPAGWHIPNRGEWQTLANYLSFFYGGETPFIAKAMASATGWDFYTTDGTVGYNQEINNASGFNAQPAGFLFGASGFTFKDKGRRTMWYTQGELPLEYDSPPYLTLGNWMSEFNTQLATIYCEMQPCFWPSFSIRCVKD